MKAKLKDVFQYVIIVVLGLLLAINYCLFIVPNDFAPAGINGIAVMVQYKMNFSIGYMSLIINIPLCAMAFFLIKRKFAVRSLVFCLSYSLFYLILQNFELLSSFEYDAGGIDTIYPVTIAGLLSGFVYGALFGIDSCTGGTDIISKLVTKKHPELNFFWVTFGLNSVVAIASLFVYSANADGRTVYNLKPVCLCMLYCFISSYVGRLFVNRGRSASQFVLITDNPEPIEKEICTILHHSATRLEGTGIYSSQKKYVLICLINNNQVADFEEILTHHPGVFVIEQTAVGIIGNFKHIANTRRL